MNALKLACCLTLTLSLAACSSPSCPDPVPFQATTYDVSEELLADLESAFDVDRSELPCEAVCDFVYEDEGDGERLDASTCALSLDEPGQSPQDIAGEVDCEGETFTACD